MHVFAGPTAYGLPESARRIPGVVWHPPARRGSVALLHEGSSEPGCIALVDGRYDDVPAVGHREILSAMKDGWRVWGLASMGALRAAELAEHGMRGFGVVYAHLAATDAPDDHVALLHEPGPEYRPLTEALVDLRGFTDGLVDDGVLPCGQASEIVAVMSRMWFGYRTRLRWLTAIRTIVGDAAVEAARDVRRPGVKSEDLCAFLAETPWASTDSPPMSSPVPGQPLRWAESRIARPGPRSTAW